jgi:hypothetical protein
MGKRRGEEKEFRLFLPKVGNTNLSNFSGKEGIIFHLSFVIFHLFISDHNLDER